MTGPRIGAHPRASWSPERIEMLKALWATGLGAVAIAAELNKLPGNKLSSDAVIGKRDRLHLVPRSNLLRQINARRARPTEARQPRAVADPGAKSLGGPPIPLPRHVVPARAWKPLDGSCPVTLMHLAPRCCKWPVELPGEAEPHFCGLPATGPYCGTHAKRAVGLGTPSEREAVKVLKRVAA